MVLFKEGYRPMIILSALSDLILSFV